MRELMEFSLAALEITEGTKEMWQEQLKGDTKWPYNQVIKLETGPQSNGTHGLMLNQGADQGWSCCARYVRHLGLYLKSQGKPLKCFRWEAESVSTFHIKISKLSYEEWIEAREEWKQRGCFGAPSVGQGKESGTWKFESGERRGSGQRFRR